MQDEQDGWTKKELQIWKNPVASLAAAVIRQWHKDGQPEVSKDCILEWANILQGTIGNSKDFL